MAKLSSDERNAIAAPPFAFLLRCKGSIGNARPVPDAVRLLQAERVSDAGRGAVSDLPG